ncbi:hypothetical protein [Pontibacillus litoralis]|uniref:Uncharacterized protein n=1 Tax=Pontibacillus litoralis JSM 072002 TaxID=1385512 RepID=A0A0A5FZ52_9BACI|nr:hypothetical protein [Pontibacillus litoralis]KGX86116.1 hypothetical protein N784_06010 [Pontibacillus litoralis JSM 072002]
MFFIKNNTLHPSKGGVYLEKRNNWLRRKKIKGKEKIVKRLTLIIALGSITIGTAAHLVTETHSSYTDSSKTSPSLQACEVFPSYINDQWKETYNAFITLKSLQQELRHFVAEPEQEQIRTIQGLNTMSSEELTTLSTYYNQYINEGNEQLTYLKELDQSIEQMKLAMQTESFIIVKHLIELSSYPSDIDKQCLKGEYGDYPSKVQSEIKMYESFEQLQISTIVQYYENVSNGQSIAAPSIYSKKELQDKFDALIDSEISKTNRQMNNFRVALEKWIKQAEKNKLKVDAAMEEYKEQDDKEAPSSNEQHTRPKNDNKAQQKQQDENNLEESHEQDHSSTEQPSKQEDDSSAQKDHPKQKEPNNTEDKDAQKEEQTKKGSEQEQKMKGEELDHPMQDEQAEEAEQPSNETAKSE